MKTADFDYELPRRFIAQTPIEPRDHSRLMVVNRKDETISHSLFYELIKYLEPGDLLVMNQTRVIPARLIGSKKTGGKVEILLLTKKDDYSWLALVGGKGLTENVPIFVENGPSCRVIQVLDGSQRVIQFSEPIESYLPLIGNIPLPPYINEELKDPERYQTVYGKIPGSAAAPTAGLHFTDQLIKKILTCDVKISLITLHVGLDTFAPVTENDPAKHIIHKEWYEISEETCQSINETRKAGGRIIAVGTTSVRSLESAACQSVIKDKSSKLLPYSGNTDLFIWPGYKFKLVDSMITNFHLPKSTLIMLVSAFAGKDTIFSAYDLAIKENYRFFSFGDAMMIL